MGTPWIIIVLASILCLTSAQFEGRYNRFRPTQRIRVNDGRYRPSDDGKYRPLNDGRYRPDNGGKYVYKGDGSGRYRSDEGKYIHKDVGGGQYSGGGGQYTGNVEQYRGDEGKYVHKDVSGGQYTGGNANNTGDDGKYSGEAGKVFAPSVGSSGTDISQIKPLTQGKGTAAGGDGWRIIRDVKEYNEDGYHYLYETENGILAEEAGNIENRGTDEEGLKSAGFYEYTGDDGLLYRVDYVADNNGFVPRGDHIPKTPRIIEKLVAYLATKPPITN